MPEKPHGGPACIWLFDRRDRWRDLYSRILSEAGYRVVAADLAVFPPPRLSRDCEKPDLVLVACAAVTSGERSILKQAARDHGLPVVMLVAVLRPPGMRELFLAGAFDVLDLPVEREGLLRAVRQAFLDLEPKPRPTKLLIASA